MSNQIPSCSAIDTGLFITTYGGAKTCCSGAYDIGNLNNATISEIYNNNKYFNIRNTLLEEPTHKYCVQCDHHEKLSGSSQRISFNKEFPSPGHRQIKQIDIRWSNVCNLACRYCHPIDSSEWAKLKGVPIKSTNRDYSTDVLETVSAHRDTIECAYLLGGEPLLQKYNVSMLDLLRTDTKIDILTNLSVDLTNNKVYQKLRNFENVIWNISFDNIGDRFEYVRHGASWNLLIKNLATVAKDFGLHTINFHPVYSIWSGFALKEFVDFAHSMKVRVAWQLANEYDAGNVKFLSGFRVFNHSPAIRMAAIKHIETVPQIPFFEQIKSSLVEGEPIPGIGKRFVEWTKEVETLAPPKKTFSELWPEVWDLLHQNN